MGLACEHSYYSDLGDEAFNVLREYSLGRINVHRDATLLEPYLGGG